MDLKMYPRIIHVFTFIFGCPVSCCLQNAGNAVIKNLIFFKSFGEEYPQTRPPVPFTKTSYLHRAQWRYYFYLSHVEISVLSWLLRWSANKKFQGNKKGCILPVNFISSYKINRMLHGHAGIRILPCFIFYLVLIVSLTSERSEF